MANLKGKDYIETQDLSDDELGLLLDTSADLKAKYHRGATDDYTRFMEEVKASNKEEAVPGIVRKHGPRSQRLRWLIFGPYAGTGHPVPVYWTQLCALGRGWKIFICVAVFAVLAFVLYLAFR